MQKCERCIHQRACKRQADIHIAKVYAVKCELFEKASDHEQIEKFLNAIMSQAQAGISWIKGRDENLSIATTYFNRVYAFADTLKHLELGTELSEYTLAEFPDPIKYETENN